jgi:hypothetical protein
VLRTAPRAGFTLPGDRHGPAHDDQGATAGRPATPQAPSGTSPPLADRRDYRGCRQLAASVRSTADEAPRRPHRRHRPARRRAGARRARLPRAGTRHRRAQPRRHHRRAHLLGATGTSPRAPPASRRTWPTRSPTTRPALGGNCSAWLARQPLHDERTYLDFPTTVDRRVAAQHECAMWTHELGHALGLGHTSDGTVMDPQRLGMPVACVPMGAHRLPGPAPALLPPTDRGPAPLDDRAPIAIRPRKTTGPGSPR